MSDGHKTPFVKVRVSDFLWGYEDELACLTEPEKQHQHDANQVETDWDADFWQPELIGGDAEQTGKSHTAKKDKFVKKRNFRRPDGKCMFGVLAEKNYTWEGSVSMMSGRTIFTCLLQIMLVIHELQDSMSCTLGAQIPKIGIPNILKFSGPKTRWPPFFFSFLVVRMLTTQDKHNI